MGIGTKRRRRSTPPTLLRNIRTQVRILLMFWVPLTRLTGDIQAHHGLAVRILTQTSRLREAEKSTKMDLGIHLSSHFKIPLLVALSVLEIPTSQEVTSLVSAIPKESCLHM